MNGLGMVTTGTSGAIIVGIIQLLIGGLFISYAVADMVVLIKVHYWQYDVKWPEKLSLLHPSVIVRGC